MAAKMELCVDVFKTNVKKKSDAEVIVQLLSNYFPNHEINFDLDDCDKILRFAGTENNPLFVKNALMQHGFLAEMLT